MLELQANQVIRIICAPASECKYWLLHCFWYLQMNSTVEEQTPHIVQNNGHQRRRSVLSNQFWGKVVIELSVGQSQLQLHSMYTNIHCWMICVIG